MRTGLFLSRGGGIISETVDVDALAEQFAHLTVARVVDSFFTRSGHEEILKAVDQHKLEAVVFAGNSPERFEGTLGGTPILEALKAKGLNDNKIAFANIKEQVALPHKGARAKATAKARLLIEAALAKVEMCHDTKIMTLAPRKSALVIGTTLGGLVAARELLAKNYRVVLVEKGPQLRVKESNEADLLTTVTAVQLDERASFVFDADVADVRGRCGDYQVVLSTPSGPLELAVGGIIVSAGDDIDWLATLKPKLQLDTDAEGRLRARHEIGAIGRTRDPGVWFVPAANGGGVAAEAGSAGMAVLSLTTLLDADEIAHPIWVSEVDENVCGGCGTCVKTCAFAASSIDQIRKVSVIDIDRCKGCGNCVVACPTGARDIMSYPAKYFLKAIDVLSRGTAEGSEPKILAILCGGSGYPAADAAGEWSQGAEQPKWSTNVMPLRVECGGNVDTQYILRAFNQGFDGIAIFACRDDHCHFCVGNTDMQRRLGLFREVLRSRHIDDARLRVTNVWPDDGQLFSEEMASFSAELKTLNSGERR
jgi:F420-non-reducing hydrogenase iron-sulfur subunit